MFAAIARPSDAYQPSHAPGTPPDRAGSARHRRPRSARAVATPIVVSLVAALLLAFGAALIPASALGATSATARCDGAALRTRPSATATRVARVGAGTKVVAVLRVTGGRWHLKCAGSTSSGRSWWKITIVNGKTAKSRYNRTVVYAASGLFKATPTMLQAACQGARLRTAPSTSARTKTQLANGARVTATWAVPGDHWSFTCGGSKSGKGWYRITAIDGVSVRSLYGVSAVYAARGLLKTAASIVPPPPDTSGYIEGIDVSH